MKAIIVKENKFNDLFERFRNELDLIKLSRKEDPNYDIERAINYHVCKLKTNLVSSD